MSSHALIDDSRFTTEERYEFPRLVKFFEERFFVRQHLLREPQLDGAFALPRFEQFLRRTQVTALPRRMR
jgi:hypothetical protein